MSKKDLPAMYSTAFWCLIVVYCFLLPLLRTRCYSFHRTKWRLVTSICRGPGPVATRMPFFCRNSNPIHCKLFSSSPRGKPLLPLWEIGSKKDAQFPHQIEPFVPDFEARLAFVQIADLSNIFLIKSLLYFQRSPVTRHRRVTYGM